MKKLLIAAFTAASLAAVGLFVAAPAFAKDQPPHKSYVCKYVGTPGVDEVLQTGDNPIWVDNHSLGDHDGLTFVGQVFTDQHGRSVVIVANTDKLDPEPGIDQCSTEPPVVVQPEFDPAASVEFICFDATLTFDNSASVDGDVLDSGSVTFVATVNGTEVASVTVPAGSTDVQPISGLFTGDVVTISVGDEVLADATADFSECISDNPPMPPNPPVAGPPLAGPPVAGPGPSPVALPETL